MKDGVTKIPNKTVQNEYWIKNFLSVQCATSTINQHDICSDVSVPLHCALQKQTPSLPQYQKQQRRFVKLK